VFDTLTQLRRVWPKGGSEGCKDHRLGTLNEFFGMKAQTHRAMRDVRDTIEVLRNVATLHFLSSSEPSLRALMEEERASRTFSDGLDWTVGHASTPDDVVVLLGEAVRNRRDVVLRYSTQKQQRESNRQKRGKGADDVAAPCDQVYEGKVKRWEEEGTRFVFSCRGPQHASRRLVVGGVMEAWYREGSRALDGPGRSRYVDTRSAETRCPSGGERGRRTDPIYRQRVFDVTLGCLFLVLMFALHELMGYWTTERR
jgi:hypothetical protein